MSTCYNLYKEKHISIKEVLEFVKSFGGYVVNNLDMQEIIPDHAIGIVEKGRAIIWVYYSNDLSDFSEGIELFSKELGTKANTVITVEHGKDIETDQMVYNFYLEFLSKYPDAYLLGDNDKFFSYDELSRFKINKEGVWEFLISH